MSFGISNLLYYIINDSYREYFKTEANWSLSLTIFFIVVYIVGSVVVIRQNKNPDEFQWYTFVSGKLKKQESRGINLPIQSIIIDYNPLRW